MNFPKYLFQQKHLGFTLIELTLIIIMLGILAVTVVPKMLTSSGFEEYTYQDEIVTKLSAIQLRIMQQRPNDACQSIKLTSSSLGLLATTSDSNTCEANFAGDTTTVTINNSHNVSFSNTESLTSFTFSPLGRPLGCITTTPCEITFTITGESILKVLVNSEGYIYAL